MVARPLWTIANWTYHKIKREPSSIHNTEVALLSAIPLVGNFAYLTNLLEDPQMFDFYVHHLARNIGRESLEKILTAPAVKKVVSSCLSYARTNYELPFVVYSAAETARGDSALVPSLVALGILGSDARKNGASFLPRAVRMQSLYLSALVLQANQEYVFSNPHALALVSLLTLTGVGCTIKAARADVTSQSSPLNRNYNQCPAS